MAVFKAQFHGKTFIRNKATFCGASDDILFAGHLLWPSALPQQHFVFVVDEEEAGLWHGEELLLGGEERRHLVAATHI